MENITKIVNRKKKGIDCTENESAEIKGWLRDNVHYLFTQEETMADIVEYFPIEYSEFLETI